MLKVAVLDDYQRLSPRSADWSMLDGECEITVFDRPLSGIEEAAEALAPFHVVCLIRERMAFPRALIERLLDLKLICITGLYNRTLDIAAAEERGIVVSHTEWRGTYHHATAELAWALILAVARHIPLEASSMRAGGWQNSVGITLSGRTLGLLGLGRQGRRMAPVAQALGMEVIAWSPNLTAESAAEVGVRRVDKEELFATSDVLSVHLVLGERSRGMVGAAELALMKPSALLVNTARGPIVDETALISALRENRIAGAGLDVFDQEPLPDHHPLRALENAVLTPHLGYNVEEFFQVGFTGTVENIRAYLDGAPIRLLSADRNFSSPPR